MRPLAAERTEVSLVDDVTPMQHDDAVGVIGLQRFRPRHRLGAAERHIRHGVQIRSFGARQFPHSRPTRNSERRPELTPMRKTTAPLREAIVATVLKANQLRRRRRRADHPLQHVRIGRSSIGEVDCDGHFRSLSVIIGDEFIDDDSGGGIEPLPRTFQVAVNLVYEKSMGLTTPRPPLFKTCV